LLFFFKENFKKGDKKFQLQKKVTENFGHQINDGDRSIIERMTVIMQPKFSLVEKR
jgi:phenylpropionate dioxygenase-like ring-hydroxylating dioxygenase large terminal subunit